MGAKTGIEWTDATWNPLRGCSRVSEGCRNCYAEKVAYRFSGEGQPYEGLAVLKNGHASWTGKVELVEKHLLDPLKWRPVRVHQSGCTKALGPQAGCSCFGDGKHATRPRRIFVNSMSDLFHENVSWEWTNKIFAVMALSPRHTFQILTKRPEVMRQYIESIGNGAKDDKWFLQGAADGLVDNCGVLEDHPWPLPNVWLGVSTENQEAADKRIPLLLQTPACVRFISAEPLLGPVDLSIIPRPFEFHQSPYGWDKWLAKKLHWVICGGESGTGARPMHPDWARTLRDQCNASQVPFFFKQRGEWSEVGGGLPHRTHDVDHSPLDMTVPIDSTNCVLSVDGHRPTAQGDMHPGVPYRWLSRIGKRAAGAILDGIEHRSFPVARVKEGALHEGS